MIHLTKPVYMQAMAGVALWTLIVPLALAGSYADRPESSDLNETVEKAIAGGYALVERDTVVGRSVGFFPYCGHGQSYFSSLQAELECLPGLYINHASGPLNTNDTGWLYFTLAAWRAEAGLSINGFRRRAEPGGEYSYGYSQAGDIIGSWIFEDIEAGYSALKWTVWANYSKVSAETRRYGDRDTTSYAAAVAGWNAAAWNGDSGGAIYNVQASKGLTSWGNIAFSSARSRSKISVNALPPIARSMDIYLFPINYGYGLFLDFDSTGCADFGKWYRHGTVSEFSGSTYTTDYIGDINTCPLTLAGLYDSAPNNAYSFYVSYACLLMKWNFIQP